MCTDVCGVWTVRLLRERLCEMEAQCCRAVRRCSRSEGETDSFMWPVLACGTPCMPLSFIRVQVGFHLQAPFAVTAQDRIALAGLCSVPEAGAWYTLLVGFVCQLFM